MPNDVANVTLKHERSMIGNAEKMTTRLEQLITLLKSRGLLGTTEYRDRLLKLQGEVIAWKAHNLRLLQTFHTIHNLVLQLQRQAVT